MYLFMDITLIKRYSVEIFCTENLLQKHCCSPLLVKVLLFLCDIFSLLPPVENTVYFNTYIDT